MRMPRTSLQEAVRLAELKSYCVLDSETESSYDDITRLASLICQTPIALISLVDEKRLWFKSKVGFDAPEMPLGISFCGHAIHSSEIFIVSDALADERFFDNPLILNTPHVRFYAGVPLVTSQDIAIGTICVLDSVPRVLNQTQTESLASLARQVVAQLELRKRNHELKERMNETVEISAVLSEQERSIRHLYDVTSAPGLSLDQKIDNLLRFGVEWSGLSVGILAKIENSTCTITNVYTSGPQFLKGDQFALTGTLSEQAIQTHEPICFEFAEKSQWRSHPIHQILHFEAHLGIPVFVDEVIYGILNFSSTAPRKKPFTVAEKRFGQLMAQWIGLELMRMQHLLEIEKQQKTLLYSAKMVSLGEMAGGIAHEINNPMAMISGRSQLLRAMVQRNELDAATVLGALDKIDSTVLRITRVVKGLRDFSRNAESEDFVATRVKEIVENSLELCRTRFTNEGTFFHVSEVSDDLLIECRPVQVSQVLLNLLSNAADAVIDKKDRWVELNIIDSGDRVQFKVRDCGDGVPRHLHQKIMQPFFSTKEIGKGTGLGLSISLGLVGKHSGKFYLDASDPHTSFVAEFPKLQTRLKDAK